MSEGEPRNKVEAVLVAATAPLTLDEIVKAAFGRLTDRGRSSTRVYLHRLDEAGRLVRYPRRYELKREVKAKS